MGKIIQDIWILQPTGLVLFQRVFEQKMDSQLFGGFICALDTFATNFDSEGISKFELSNKQFLIAQKNNLLFIVDYSPKANLKSVQAELQSIVKKFFDIYPPAIWTNWNGDLSMFDNFSTQIQNSLEDVVANFQKAFW